MEVKQVKDLLEAYSSIYEKKEEPEMEEGEGKESEKDEGGNHKEGKHPKGKEEKGEKVTEKEGKEKEDEREMKEGADLFDYILEHLVAEGYADTNQAALAIMANMSEEWKKSILEDSNEDKKRLLRYDVRYYQKHGGMPDDPEIRRQLRDAARKLPPA